MSIAMQAARGEFPFPLTYLPLLIIINDINRYYFLCTYRWHIFQLSLVMTTWEASRTGNAGIGKEIFN